MTEKQITEIIKTNKYTLKGWEYIYHYDMALFLLIPTVMPIILYFPQYEVDNFLFSIAMITLPISLYIFIYQGPSQLNFNKIKIPEKSKNETYLISLDLVKRLKWEVIEDNSSLFINAFNSWGWSFNDDIGQSILIIPMDNEIRILSLYTRRTSATFWRPNKNDNNIKRFKKGLEILLKN